MSLFFANLMKFSLKSVVKNKKNPDIIKKNSTGMDEYAKQDFKLY